MPEMAIVPPGGGWRFMQRLPNGGFHTFVEPTEDRLYNKVLEFRMNSNMPTENLREELKRGVSIPYAPKHTDQKSLRERVTSWLANKQFGVIKYVSPEEATARAKLAAACPYNTTNYADDCLECYNSTLRGLFSLRQGRTTPYDEQLGACRNCGWDNRTVVHLQASSLLINPSEVKPCWCSQLDKDATKEVG